MMSFSAKTGAAVLRYSMARASARAETLYCDPGSRAAWAAPPEPMTTPAAVAARPAVRETARTLNRTGWRARRRSAMRSDPPGRGEDLLLAELVGLAHEPDPPPVQDVDAVGQFQCRSEEHTSELQSQSNLVCRLLLEKK